MVHRHRPRKGDPVIVEWVDSATTAGWHDDFDDDDGLVHCRTAGFLYANGPRAVKIVQSRTALGQHADMIAIPKACVRSITRLERKGT